LTFLFTVFFWTFAFAWMGILALVTIFLRLFFKYPAIHNRVPAPGLHLIMRVATLGRFRVTYDPGFDPDRRSVFCMNHTNLLDGHTATAVVPHALCGLMNSWHFWIPCYGWLMKLSRGIGVRPEDRGRVLQRITEEARRRREENMSIVAFPEAHRTRDGLVQRFRKGVFFMARDAGYPVVPVAARGMYAVNRKGSFLFRPRPVDVYVGPQFETSGLTDSQISDLTGKFQRMISSYVELQDTSERKEAINA
jgi:1-acyl-sn-glycerol-3-phosphate acyltransferase